MENDGFKTCPFCKENIRKEAVKCRFCGEWLEETFRPKSESNQKDEHPAPTPLIESGQRFTVKSTDSATIPKTQEPVASKSSAAPVDTTNDLRGYSSIKENPFIPLLLAILWICWFALPKAIEYGVSSVPILIYDTFLYCTAPISIAVLFLLAYWLWAARRNFRLAPLSSQVLKRPPVQKIKIITIIALFLISGFFTYKKIHLAWEQRTASDRQELQARGINLDAYKSWEFTKKETKIANGTNGLSPELKKRMREVFTMQLKGLLGSEPSLTVDLNGDEHDKLVLSFDGIMKPAIAETLPDALQKADADFWNRMRFLDFKALVLAGTNYSESITQAQFIQWSRGYETFVSNMTSTYGKTGNQNNIFESKQEHYSRHAIDNATGTRHNVAGVNEGHIWFF